LSKVAYLVKIFENQAFSRCLFQEHPEVTAEFEAIVKTVTLGQ